MDDERHWSVGVDWASESHRVWVCDARGNKLGERSFAHDGAGLAAMAAWTCGVTGAPPEAVDVAIEVPHGPVVESLRPAKAPRALNDPDRRVVFVLDIDLRVAQLVKRRIGIEWGRTQNPPNHHLGANHVPRRQPLHRTRCWWIRHSVAARSRTARSNRNERASLLICSGGRGTVVTDIWAGRPQALGFADSFRRRPDDPSRALAAEPRRGHLA